jgi:hypothetical protein
MRCNLQQGSSTKLVGPLWRCECVCCSTALLHNGVLLLTYTVLTISVSLIPRRPDRSNPFPTSVGGEDMRGAWR